MDVDGELKPWHDELSGKRLGCQGRGPLKKRVANAKFKWF